MSKPTTPPLTGEEQPQKITVVLQPHHIKFIDSKIKNARRINTRSKLLQKMLDEYIYIYYPIRKKTVREKINQSRLNKEKLT